jgi:hypothetical protein
LLSVINKDITPDWLHHSNTQNNIIVSTRAGRNRQILLQIRQEIQRRNQQAQVTQPSIMDAAQMQAFVDALIAAATASTNAANLTAAAIVPPAAPATATVPFALLPGEANVQPLDWSKAESMKLFNKAITAIDTKFALSEDNLRTFIEQVRERSRIFNWETLLTVTDSGGNARNLLDCYGLVTIENCRVHADQHVGIPAGSPAGTAAADTRTAQDSMMLYQFLLNSLTDAAKLTILSDKDLYYVNGHPSGVCFLKVIIGRSSIDTNAKISLLRKKIARLTETMKNEFKGNVREFNTYVSLQKDQLLGRGQDVSELITHLFDAYLSGVADEEFHRYIETYQNQYDDGMVITPERLMQNALTKYDTIMQRREASSESENRVIALKAEATKDEQLATLTAQIAALQANYAAKGNEKGKTSTKVNAAKKIPAWKKVAPADNESKTIVKTINDKKKTFHWCPNHQMWTIHLPKDCTYGKEGNDSNKNSTEKKADDQQLMINKAMLAFLNQDIDE